VNRVWRSVRDSLATEVDPHAASFLGRRIAGMPGPVWTLVAWALVMALVSLLNLLALALSGDPALGRLGILAYWAGTAILIRVIGPRTPGWLVHLMLDLNIVMICVTSATALNDLRAVSTLTFLVVPAVFMATWMSRQQIAAHLLVLVLGSAAVVIVMGADRDTVRVWLTLLAVCLALTYFINALVTHLNQQATVDPLTGLFNRSGLDAVTGPQARVGVALPRTVVVVDLDGFKSVNDTMGHTAGDEILRQVGATMRSHLRPNDTVTRTGGDEFVILLARTDVRQAQTIVDRLVEALPLPASVGLVDWPEDVTIELAIAEADALMYRAKASRPGDMV
jgi:diguanylate cyclase (GGDEF)-like protein